MLNRVVLMGRLTAIPELKTTATGKSVTSFSVAVDRNFVKAGKERKADFFNIVCWNNTAEFVCRYFTKGSLVALEGRLQSRTYKTDDGNNRYITEVVADTVSFTGERRDNSNVNYDTAADSVPSEQPLTSANKNSSAIPEQPPMSAHNDFEDMPIDDDLPF